MSPIKSYRELVARQKGFELSVAVYRATVSFPQCEQYGLTSQLRRAAVSIPSNIAEGQGKATTGEFLQHLGHARGSLYEVQTQLMIAQELNYLGGETGVFLNDLSNVLARVLNGLIASLRSQQA